MVVEGYSPLEVAVDDVENSSHPERVAGVDEFISPAVESSKLGLPMGEPVH